MTHATEYRLHRVRGRDGLYEVPDGILLGHNNTESGVEVLVLVRV